MGHQITANPGVSQRFFWLFWTLISAPLADKKFCLQINA
jgi:hypothetical protein